MASPFRCPGALVLLLLLGLPARAAQEQPPPQQQEEPAAEQPPEEQEETAREPAPDQPPAQEPVPAPSRQPPPRDRSRDGLLPRLDVYFPEGEIDLRVNRLINKVFFEGQVKYDFIDGDIAAFLRYRYYGYGRVTQFAVFDAIEFDEIEELSSEFDRVRGLLMLFQWPHTYNRRTFLLTEIDRIASNKEELVFNTNRTNNYIRLGYQFGTPEDARSNAIVGETRARSERLFTAAREIGPGGAGFTGAVTYSFDALLGDFDYVKAEGEAVKRFDLSKSTFLVGRLHAGSFLQKSQIRPDQEEPVDRFSIPRAEFFRLDGRENLRGLKDRLRGTEEIHTTWEYFFPWFLGASHDFLRLEWQNWYWILYSGIGNVGFDREVYRDFGSYVPDVGVGFESSFRLRGKYRFFLSGIVAQALKGSEGVEARISVKSYR